MPDFIAQLDLISTKALTILCVITALAIGMTVWIIVRRRRRWGLRAGFAGLFALVAVVATTADFFNAHYAYLPMVSDVTSVITGDRQWLAADQLDSLSPAQQERAEKQGAVVRDGLPADPANGLGRTSLILYLPPQYFSDPDARFPVVYLMHGSPGRAADWFHAARGDVFGPQLARDGHPAILVAAQLSKSWGADSECVDGSHAKIESHVFQQVIPTVDRTYRSVPSREERTFAGMSAGGYCALNLGLRHRDTVSTIVDLSGYTMPTHDGGARALFGGDEKSAQAKARDNSPAVYASGLPRSPATRVWLDTGTDDGTVLKEMRALEPVLRERGIEVTLHTRPGGHTYRVWTAALAQALPWAVADQSV